MTYLVDCSSFYNRKKFVYLYYFIFIIILFVYYFVHSTKFKYFQYFLAVQMQLSPPLAPLLSLPHSLHFSCSLSCSISILLPLSLSRCSIVSSTTPLSLGLPVVVFRFCLPRVAIGRHPVVHSHFGLAFPPARFNALPLVCLPPENSFAAHRGALWLPSHRSCISADAFVSVSLNCMCVSYGWHA